MNRHILLLVWMLVGFASGLYAQFTPQGFSYQSIVRDQNGDPLGNQTVGLLFTIRSGAPNGPIAYSEKQTLSTNNYGLVNTDIGTGTPIQGTFASINWGGGAKYLSVSIETMPNIFDELGSTQLMSVPYALYAQTAANGGGGGGGDNWGSQVVQTSPAISGNGTAASPLNIAPQGAQPGQVLKWDGTKWIPQDDVSSTGSGGGTLTQINTGAGLTGGPITTTGTIGLSNTGVTPGSYGSASQIPVITVDAQGRVTGVFNTVASPGTITLNEGNGIDVQQNGTIYTVTNTGILTTTQADGDVTGTFSNLQIKPNAVGTGELANGSVTAAKLNNMSATNGQVLKWNGTAWAPAADQGGTTNLFAGTGISVTGAAPNLTINNTGDTNAADDITTATLANGDVSGPFNNLQINSSAVGTNEVADNAITTAKVNNGAITAAKLNSMSATNGQVLKWNGTAWAPAPDQTGAGAVVNAGPGIDVAVSGNTYTVINTGDENSFDDVTITSIAGGDLNGPFSNLQINPFAVTNTELANNAVGTTNVINGAITGAKINNMGAANGQVLKWNGTTWAPANDNAGGGTGDNWGTQTATTNLTLSGNGTPGSPLGIAPQGAVAGQTLKFNGVTWIPSPDLNDGPDNWGTQSVETSPELIGDGTSGNKLAIAPQGATAGQVLKFNGSTWEPDTDANDGPDNWGTQTVETSIELIGDGTSGNKLAIAPQGATAGQVLKFNGSTWEPDTDANDGPDDWGTQTVETDGSALEGNGTLGNPLRLSQQSATSGQVLKWDGTNWTPQSDNSGGAGDFYIGGTGISITGTAPNFIINNTGDNDNDPTNELQTINLTGSALTLSNGGGTVNIPAGNNYTEGAGIDITGSAPNFTIVNSGDLSNTNEIQTLSLTGNQLDLSNGGGSVVLPGGNTYAAGTGISITGTSPNFTINNTGDTDNDASNEIQDLSLNGTMLEISGGGTGVDLNNLLVTVGQGFWALAGADINNVNAGNVLVGDLTPGVGKFQVKTTGGTAGFFSSVGGNALLTGDGNVGINNNAPAFRLDVSGEQRVQGVGNLLTLEQKVGGDYAKMLLKNSGSMGSWEVAGQSGGDFFITYAPVNSAGGVQRIFSARQNGSVGIGAVNTTATRLRVFHEASSGLGIENSASGGFWEFWVRDTDGALVLYNNALGAVPAGTFASNGFYAPSDRRLKKDIAAVQGSFLDKIMQLEAYSYLYNAEKDEAKRSLGFMAQDVQVQFPELVTENKNREGDGSFLALNYAGLSVVAIKAIQEQQQQIKNLQNENDKLKQQMSDFEKRLQALENQQAKRN
ncbi:MAG: tail fiber domain-containing protein [Saprospiraceae bacterium]|nr:tail fiber domain-containing protein [Saprospiraceae bacterium]